jgi:hypothetical protein
LEGYESYLAAFVALLGVLVGLYWNFRSARAARKQPFLLKQLDLCHDASLAAARLASLRDRDQWLDARQRFWELFYGPLSIVEDGQVKTAMEAFGRELAALNEMPPLPASSLEQPSYRLARAMRVLILNSWSITGLARVLEDEGRSGQHGQG